MLVLLLLPYLQELILTAEKIFFGILTFFQVRMSTTPAKVMEFLNGLVARCQMS
jgi:hypothetical protein